ncbi:MAG TPA: hypothetical protein VKD90_23005 [Gemmataceae bacterium]|nr:hypothetical protein [Gemmataceae bacterium]
MSATLEPVRRRKNDRSEIPVSFLPEGNQTARRAYVCALLGLIPGLGPFFGPPAILLGLLGARAARRDEQKRGLGHAWASCILGEVELVSGAAGWLCLGHGLGWL